jgi:hypothetical protein
MRHAAFIRGLLVAGVVTVALWSVVVLLIIAAVQVVAGLVGA